ncbi:MAG: MBL fold metallo-hydrolase [Bacteroidetes bacterium]|nr:MBL fold metallo-hydrolase [Bacteroidota bacterium]MCH8523807.1 MBL fold metallo-hydrolase [Balneolales bacterium]
MNIQLFTVNPFQENSYLVSEKGRAFVVDPGFFNAMEMNLLNQAVKKDNLQLEAIVLTHAHLDHVFGIDRVRSQYGEIPVYLHEEDAYFWENYMLSAARFGFDVKPFDFHPDWISEGDFECAGIKFKGLFTPGHAPGHLAFYHQESGQLLSGDALFRESVGRTDLYKGDADLLAQSIRTQLYTLPEETVVFPGHGPETTIGHEKQHNPFVRA